MNKMIKNVMWCSLIALFSCGKGNEKKIEQYMPELSAQEIEKGVFTPEIMLKMKRLGNVSLSKDGNTALYSTTVVDVENNKSYSNLYVKGIKDTSARQITFGNFKDWDSCFSKDMNKIYFLSNRSGSTQIWSVNIDGTSLQKLSDLTFEIGTFKLSPENDMILYTTQVKVDTTAKDIHTDMSQSKVKIYDDLMVRHWDYWLDGSYSHPFIAKFNNGKLSDAKDIIDGEAWDVPMAPYFDASDITWNNNGTQIAYSAKKLKGKEYAMSTNSDIYVYDIVSGKSINLTEGMMGYDRCPVFSDNDKYIAFTSMERPGNESDKERLFVIDVVSGQKRYLTNDFDYNASSIQWNGNENIYFIAPMQATHQICRVGVENNSPVEVLTQGDHDYTNCIFNNGTLLTEKTTLSMAPELFLVDATSGNDSQLSFLNNHIYNVIKMGNTEKRMVTTTDNKQMLTWVLTPPYFDPEKKYPTLLYCQGGPQSVVSQRWSYRWNLQLMASMGYVVVAPNRRGLPSFGQEWLDQISGDYSGQNIQDYLSAIDDVSKEKWVDTSKRGCVGASYGGYSTFFLAGNHEKRFKTFISHCGMFNFESFYGSTEELWFPNNDLKGTYWSDNQTAKRSYANSPHKFVDKWDSPIMIIVGEKDYRIPYTESLQAFTAAQLKGLDSRLVVFEDEGHQVFKPQNAIVWHKEFFGWLDKYLK